MSDTIQKVDRRTREYRQQKAAQAAPPADTRMIIDAEGGGSGGGRVESVIIGTGGGAGGAAGAAPRTQTRVSPRTKADGRMEVVGRGGEVLSRTRTYVGDIFEIPKELMEPGWSLQWNAVSIAGNSDIILDQNHMMHQNGWRPVPAERFAGKLVPKGSTGPIIRGQQMLMERPQSMTDEANREDQKNANELISARNESLKLTKVQGQLPDGMEMGKKYRGTGGGMRITTDKSMDVLNINRQSGNYSIDE